MFIRRVQEQAYEGVRGPTMTAFVLPSTCRDFSNAQILNAPAQRPAGLQGTALAVAVQYRSVLLNTGC